MNLNAGRVPVPALAGEKESGPGPEGPSLSFAAARGLVVIWWYAASDCYQARKMVALPLRAVFVRARLSTP